MQPMTSGNLKRKQPATTAEQNVQFIAEPVKKAKMVPSNKFLLAFHLVTCGLQNIDLGRDETAILQIGFQLIDIDNNQVGWISLGF